VSASMSALLIHTYTATLRAAATQHSPAMSPSATVQLQPPNQTHPCRLRQILRCSTSFTAAPPLPSLPNHTEFFSTHTVWLQNYFFCTHAALRADTDSSGVPNRYTTSRTTASARVNCAAKSPTPIAPLLIFPHFSPRALRASGGADFCFPISCSPYLQRWRLLHSHPAPPHRPLSPFDPHYSYRHRGCQCTTCSTAQQRTSFPNTSLTLPSTCSPLLRPPNFPDFSHIPQTSPQTCSFSTLVCFQFFCPHFP
jgi:hypothetical protein